ncbi:MAG TPA: sigma-70 family RNA polymerase sigma factor [Actinomycetota bacterium]|nr:sigma-70 family RNA polymerase sigma factor [Actinomycetota bacterium]
MDRERRFNALFEQTYPAVRRYAHHRGLGDADAEDLAADVFAVAWRKLDRIPADDPVPWLLAVARNHWRNHLRRRERGHRLSQRLAGRDAISVVAPEEPSASHAHILAALASLDPGDQEVLRLTAWDGLEPRQIAVVLGCSAVAARVRLHRARSRFADALDRQNDVASRPSPSPAH